MLIHTTTIHYAHPHHHHTLHFNVQGVDIYTDSSGTLTCDAEATCLSTSPGTFMPNGCTTPVAADYQYYSDSGGYETGTCNSYCGSHASDW